MAAIEYYRHLKRRKQALLVESDLNRLVLQLTVENLRDSTTRLDSTLGKIRRFGPWLLPLASIVGIFAGRRARTGGSQISWIGLALRWLPVLLRLGESRTRTN